MTWTVFHTTANPTGQNLDDNLTAIARMGVFPCTAGGTANAITLTLTDTNAPPNTAYQNYQEYSFIAAGTNNSAVTIKVGALAALNAYKDTPAGPVALASAEIVQNCCYIAMYDLALNGGSGGFHVRASGMVANSPINPSQLQVGGGGSLTRLLSGTYTVAFTVVPANTTQDATVALTNAAIGDAVMLGLPATVTAGLMFEGRVLAAGSVGIRAANVTAASIAAFTITNLKVVEIGMTP